jgi:hypothetical protein
MSERRPVPVWVRTLDALSLLLAFIAAIVAVSGGFRAHLGSLRIAVTSPLPLVAWCIGIGVVRHIAAPQQPLYREFPQRLAAWSRLPAIRAVATAVLGTRFVMLLVGYLAVFMIGFANGRAPLRHFPNELLNLPVRWDAGWYLQIVTDGYKYVPGDPSVQQNIVFFPAYPMLMRVAGRLLGGDMIGYVAAGMIISIASFLGALAYLYAFARDRYGDDVAGGAIWLLAAYPFAIFFGAEGDPKPQAIQLIAHLPPALRVPRHHDVEKIWEIPFQPDHDLANDAFFSFMSAAGQNDLGGFVDAQVRQDRPKDACEFARPSTKAGIRDSVRRRQPDQTTVRKCKAAGALFFGSTYQALNVLALRASDSRLRGRQRISWCLLFGFHLLCVNGASFAAHRQSRGSAFDTLFSALAQLPTRAWSRAADLGRGICAYPAGAVADPRQACRIDCEDRNRSGRYGGVASPGGAGSL